MSNLALLCCCPPTPTEACCLPGEPCQDLERVACLDAGGLPQGAGTACSDPNMCGLEACCLPQFEYLCADLERATCLNIDGFPQGPGSECATVECEALCDNCPWDPVECATCPSAFLIQITGLVPAHPLSTCCTSFDVTMLRNGCCWQNPVRFQGGPGGPCPCTIERGECVGPGLWTLLECGPPGQPPYDPFWWVHIRVACSATDECVPAQFFPNTIVLRLPLIVGHGCICPREGEYEVAGWPLAWDQDFPPTAIVTAA